MPMNSRKNRKFLFERQEKTQITPTEMIEKNERKRKELKMNVGIVFFIKE